MYLSHHENNGLEDRHIILFMLTLNTHIFVTAVLPVKS